MHNNSNERLLRVAEVAGTIGVAKSTVWLWVKQDILPKPFKLTPSTTVWKHSEIQEFIKQKTEKAEDDHIKEAPKSQKKAEHAYKRKSPSRIDMDNTGGGI